MTYERALKELKRQVKCWKNGKDYEPYCNHIEGTLSDTTKDDFCSHGERKEQK